MSTARDAGSVGLTTVLAAVIVLTVGGTCLAAVGDVAATSARARLAADAAALAAAGTSPLVTGVSELGGGPTAARRAAADTAGANGARLVGVDLQRWPLRVQVEAAVDPLLPWVQHVTGPMRAGATAAVRPRDT